MNTIKENGIVYTPKELSDYIAKNVLSFTDSHKNNLRVLDPAVGDGELLISLYNIASKSGIKVSLIGIDTDDDALEKARVRFATAGITNYQLIQQDFIEFATENNNAESFDLIISNPPYVSTENLGANKSQELSKILGLKGKIDLYQAFYLGIGRVLKTNGTMGVITSNKFLYNKSGKVLRKYLLDDFKLHSIIDLGDTKLFTAAVLPSILFGTKELFASQTEANFLTIYETSNQENYSPASSVYEILDMNKQGVYQIKTIQYEVKTGTIQFPINITNVWNFATDEDYEWAQHIEKTFSKRISDFGKIRVGIKTTADSVFIHDNWSKFSNPIPEENLLHPLVAANNIQRWMIADSSEMLTILYPHKIGTARKAEPINLNEYPNAKKYLEEHFEKLSGRNYIKQAGRNWYEIWVPQDPKLWDKDKIIFPDISSNARFALDTNGLYIDGNTYWLVLDDGIASDYLYLILALANSDAMDRYHEIKFQNKLYSGKRRYITQYVENYPIPSIDQPGAKIIIQLTKQLQEASNIQEKIDLEKKINLLITSLIK